MDIKGSNFIENIMIAAAVSQIKAQSTEQPTALRSLEIKVISLLDTILSSLSSAYRESRVKITSKVMMMHEAQKFGSVTKAAKKIFTDGEGSTSEKGTVKSDQTATKEQKLTQVEQQLEEMVLALPDFLQEMDVEKLFETKSDIEEKGRAYEERRNATLLAEYLLQHPEALAAFSLAYQEIASAEFAENFKECFGDLDPKGLSERNPVIEDIAEQYQIDKEMKEFNQYIGENPGALTAFLLFLQVALIKKDSEST